MCSAFLYLFVLRAFLAPAVKLMKIFSWFAGAFSIYMCFLKSQHIEISRPLYYFYKVSAKYCIPAHMTHCVSQYLIDMIVH